MRRLYFDISDIVAHARKNPRVSGMQRVQARLIGLLASRHGGDAIQCVFRGGLAGRFQACDGGGLFDDIDFSPGRLVARLGLRSPAAVFEHEERRHLKPLGPLARAAERVRLAWLTRFDRDRLERLGFTLLPPGSVRAVNRRLLGRLGPEETLVLPGATWAHADVRRLAGGVCRGGGDVISLVYDVLPAVHPEFFTPGHGRRFARYLRECPTFTSRYACISASTRDQLRHALGDRGPAAACSVLPLAHEFLGYPRDDRSAVASHPDTLAAVDRPFVLCVGTMEIRKNGANLLRAWLRARDRLGPSAPRLVFAGRRGWKIEEFDRLLATEPALAASVVIRDDPSDADLAFLYQRCLFTVFVSFAEGWGLPMGEAAWFGRHCLASSTTSMPEVCGPLFDYVAPNDVPGIAEAIVRIATDADYRAGRERAIRAAPLRTWSDVADDLYSLAMGAAASGR